MFGHLLPPKAAMEEVFGRSPRAHTTGTLRARMVEGRWRLVIPRRIADRSRLRMFL